MPFFVLMAEINHDENEFGNNDEDTTKVYKTPIDNPNDRTLTNLHNLYYYVDLLRSSCGSVGVTDHMGEDYVFVMFETDEENLQTSKYTKESIKRIVPIGFILATVSDFKRTTTPGKIIPTSYHLNLICSKHNGAQLMNYFIKFCGEAEISLVAMPQVLAYYPKFQFKSRESCDQPPIDLPDSLRNRNKATHPFPKTSNNAYNDKDYSDYIFQLLQKKHPNIRQPISKEELRTLAKTSQFKMMRCPKNLTVEAGPRETNRRPNENRKRKNTRKTRKTRKQ
jgi:hypothetical protein